MKRMLEKLKVRCMKQEENNSPKRQHPLWMFTRFIEVITQFIVPFFFIIIISPMHVEFPWIKYAVLLFVVFFFFRLFVIYFEWKNYTYLVTDTNLIINDGRLVSKKRYIPLNRIQSVQQTTPFIQKLIDLTTLNIVTGTSGENASIKISMLSLNEAKLLQKQLERYINREANSHQSENQKNDRIIRYKMSFREIFLFSITSLYFLAFIPIFFSLYTRIDNLISLDTVTVSLYETFKTSLLLVAVLLFLAFFISFIIGLIITYLRYGNYTVATDSKRIYIKRGVLSTSHFTIPKEKVNGVLIKKSFFRRLFGICEVQLVTLGDVFEEEDSTTDVLFPFINKKRATQLINEVLPDYQIQTHMKPLPAQALFLTLISPSYLLVILTVLVFYFWPEFWFIPVIYLGFLMIQRIIKHYNSKYYFDDSFIQIQTGSFSNELFITKAGSIDEISLKKSWLEDKLNVTSLVTFTRAKPLHIGGINHLPKHVSDELYTWYVSTSK